MRFRGWPVILFFLVPIVPLWRAVFAGQAIGPFDQIRQFAPWNGPAPGRPWDVLQADGALQFYAWRDLVFSAWAHGQLPLWNPYALAGTPLLGNSQSAAFYPPHILLGLLHVPTGIAMLILAWAHLSWAGLGTYMLVRRLGGSRTGAAVAGTSFALSSFMLGWSALPSVITTVSWIPWVLLGVAALFLRKSADIHDRKRATAKITAGLAGSVAMMVLSGHLQFVAYGAIAAVLVAIGLTLTLPKEARRFVGVAWVRSACAGMLGVLLAAPQLLPVLSYSQFSHRRGAPTDVGYASYVANSVATYELGDLGFAPLTGQPFAFAEGLADGSSGGAGRGSAGISAYYPQFVRQGDNYAESALALGPLVLCAVVLAPWRRRARTLVPFAVLAVLALLLALGTALNRLLYFGVPGWSASGSPGRIVVLFVLSACVLAGLGIDELPRLPPKGPVRLLPLLLPFALLGLGALVVQHYPFAEANATALSILANAAIRSALPGLLVAAILTAAVLAIAYHLNRPVNRALVILSPIFLAILAGALEIIPTGDPSFLQTSPITPTDANARIAVVNHPWSLVAAAPALFPPDTPTVARVHDLSGYDSLIHRDTVTLLRDVDGQDPAAEANGNMMFVKPTADPQQLADAGVTEVWTRHEMSQLGEPFASDRGVLRYRVSGPGRASTPIGPATIEAETMSRLNMHATGPGRLVVRDRNMPGWLAKVDGRHVPLLGTTWREVDLSPGVHEIEFNYVPPGFTLGCMLGSVALFLIVLMLATARFRAGRGSDPAKAGAVVGRDVQST